MAVLSLQISSSRAESAPIGRTEMHCGGTGPSPHKPMFIQRDRSPITPTRVARSRAASLLRQRDPSNLRFAPRGTADGPCSSPERSRCAHCFNGTEATGRQGQAPDGNSLQDSAQDAGSAERVSGDTPTLKDKPPHKMARGIAAALPGSTGRKIQLGIETEFVLAARDREDWGHDMFMFAQVLAARYNAETNLQHPRMHESLLFPDKPIDYSKWSLIWEKTNLTSVEPWGLEMATPILHASSDSKWRKHVEVTWEYLQQYYDITANPTCGTHIHVSLTPGYEVEDIRRIAMSVLYFEPAFEALVPACRRRNRYTKSHWFDSPWLARKGLSRAQSITKIEHAPLPINIMMLMQGYGDKDYAWNLWSYRFKGTVEFRKPEASLTAEEALSWAELAMNFVQASVQYGTHKNLVRVPATVGGLRWFLAQVNVPGVNDSSRLQAIWAGKDPEATLQARHRLYGDKVEKTFRDMRREDRILIRKFAKTAREPYW